jgi:hypothetical protein
MDSFMTFAVEFLVWAFVALLGVWFIGFLLWPLGFLLELLGTPTKAKPKPVINCHGHTHNSEEAVDACSILKAWDEDYRAGKVDWDGNPIPQDGELRACEKCGRNHFAGECPPTGHRVTDGRTGEVVGYWTPSDA